VIDDVCQLLGKEPEIQSVQHRAHAGDGEIAFHVFLRIPAKGADPVAPLDAQPLERGRQPFGPVAHLPEACAARGVAHESYHFAVRVDLPAIFEHEVYRQRPVLHRALNHSSP
jgi:hypothetical protein